METGNQRLFPKNAALVTIVLVCALYRVIPHAPNFTPLTALALFAGAKFADRRLALLVVFGSMFLSDLVIGFDATRPFVYGALALCVALGGIAGRDESALKTSAAVLSGSLLFFLVTNFGVWLVEPFYSKTIGGLAECFILAVPFYRTSLIADVFWSVLLFGGWSLAEHRFRALRPARA